jgi:sulfonate transport system permease protein
MINLARTYAQTDIIVVGLVVYALLGLASDAAVRWAEARALAWRRGLAA